MQVGVCPKQKRGSLNTSAQTEPRFYYGWVVVGVCLLTLTFGFGLRYCFSVFYVALFEDFGWGRAETAGIYSVHRLVYASLAPVAGWLMDRWGPRRLMPIALAVVAVGFAFSSLINDLWELYLLLGVVLAVGIVMIEYVPHSAIVARWFEGGRGFASGIAFMGMGTGALIITPFAQYLISAFGWREAFIIIGVGSFFLLAPIILIFQRQRPQDMGYEGPRLLIKSHQVVLEVIDTAWTKVSWTLGKAIKTRVFWYLLIACFLQSISGELMIVHQVAHVIDLGYSKTIAASAFGFVYFSSIAGMFFWGTASDRLGREKMFLYGTFFILAGLCMLMILDRNTMWPIYGFVVLYGFGFGSRAPLFLAVAADIFQGQGFGAIMGALAAGFGLGGAVGPWLGGWIFDTTQSYLWAFVVVGLTAAGACWFVWIAAPGKIRRPRKA